MDIEKAIDQIVEGKAKETAVSKRALGNSMPGFRAWVLSQTDLSSAYTDCPRADWLLYLLKEFVTEGVARKLCNSFMEHAKLSKGSRAWLDMAQRRLSGVNENPAMYAAFCADDTSRGVSDKASERQWQVTQVRNAVRNPWK